MRPVAYPSEVGASRRMLNVAVLLTTSSDVLETTRLTPAPRRPVSGVVVKAAIDDPAGRTKPARNYEAREGSMKPSPRVLQVAARKWPSAFDGNSKLASLSIFQTLSIRWKMERTGGH